MLNIFEIEGLTKCYLEIEKRNVRSFSYLRYKHSRVIIQYCIFVTRNLKCTDHVESICYSLAHESVCVHCGTTKRLSNSTNQFPICSNCLDFKKKPDLRRKAAEKGK